ncbi:MAG TPA: hypothetical protein VGD37_12925 [Kofleriaceae bacterium]
MNTTQQMGTDEKFRGEGMNQVEGKTTRMIEKTTASIPSATFLVLAGGAIVGSLALKLMGRHATANFVGEWVPTILMLGIYNKIVKVLGSDRQEIGSRGVGGSQGSSMMSH